MFDNLWVRRDDAVDFSGAVEDCGVGGAAGEDSGGPVEEAVAVEDEIGEGTEKWVYSEAMSSGSLEFWVEKEDIQVERNEEDGEDDWEIDDLHCCEVLRWKMKRNDKTVWKKGRLR